MKYVVDPAKVDAPFGPWWALRGHLARFAPELDGDTSFVEAISHDPLLADAACRTLDGAERPPLPEWAALCDAARHQGEPTLGRD